VNFRGSAALKTGCHWVHSSLYLDAVEERKANYAVALVCTHARGYLIVNGVSAIALRGIICRAVTSNWGSLESSVLQGGRVVRNKLISWCRASCMYLN